MTSLPADIPLESIRRLTTYRPFADGGVGLTDVLMDLVLAAAAINDGRLANHAACRQALQALWHLDFEIDELRKVRTALVARGDADASFSGVLLTGSAVRRLDETQVRSDAAEETAFTEWTSGVFEREPALTPQDLEDLREDLSTWLEHLVVRHGAEAALFLYPEENRARKLFDQLDKIDSSIFPKRSVTAQKVRDEALRRFIRQPTPEQRSLLASRLNTAFYLTVLTLDPAAKKLVQTDAKATTIYCDTNFLYELLGVGDAEEASAANRLVQLTQDLGCTVAVTPWTVGELHFSIKRVRKEEVEGFTPRQGMAEVLAEVTRGSKGFAHDFWRSHAVSGISIADYFSKIENFEITLTEQFGIKIDDTSCSKIESQPEEVREYSLALQRIVNFSKADPIADHDAKHRLLVERLRGAGNIRFSNARYWFLTQDTSLPRFAGVMPDPDHDAPELPFCISPAAWVQVARALTPRTEDYDGMIVELLASPFVGRSPVPDVKAIREVVARLDIYEDASPALAIAVLKDTALVSDIADATDEEIEQRVKAAYSSKTTELQEQARAATTRAAAERADRQAAEAKNARLAADLEEERARAQGLQTGAQRARLAQQDSEIENQQRISDLETAVASADAREQARVAAEAARVESEAAAVITAKAKTKRLRVRALGLVLLVVGLAALTATLTVPISHTFWIVLVGSITSTLAAAVGLSLLLSRRALDEARYYIGLVALVGGFLISLVHSKT